MSIMVNYKGSDRLGFTVHSTVNLCKKDLFCNLIGNQTNPTLGYFFFRILIAYLRRTPFFLLYRLADGLYLLLFYVIRYRRRVVTDNLKKAFPQFSKKTISAIAKESYRNLSDIILESIKGLTLSQ